MKFGNKLIIVLGKQLEKYLKQLDTNRIKMAAIIIHLLQILLQFS